MYLNEQYRRAVKGFTFSVMQGSKKMFLIVFASLACFPIASAVFLAVHESQYKTGTMTSSTGLLSIGFSITLITLCIAVFSSQSKEVRNQHFIWPINRKVYALGNSLVILLCSAVFISGVAVLSMLELVPSVVLRWFFSNIRLVSELTFENFLAGMWIAFTYLVLAASLVYCIGSYFFRYKIPVAVIGGSLVIAISFPVFRMIYYHIFNFILEERSVALFSVKAWVAALALNVIAYFAIRRMEVKV